MRSMRVLVLCGLAIWCGAARATVLYDGADLDFPQTEGSFSFLFNPLATWPTLTNTDGAARLGSLVSNGTMAGFFSVTGLLSTTPVSGSWPTLDSAAGFRLGFGANLLDESHASANRAGFSVILLDQFSQGIELGFWNNEVWAQSGPGFLHAEGAALATAADRWYDLWIAGGSYHLYADGTPVLSGALRDYSSFGWPYTIDNFVFLGDDTGSAGADVKIRRITLETGVGSPVPEPGTLAFALAGLALLRRRRR